MGSRMQSGLVPRAMPIAPAMGMQIPQGTNLGFNQAPVNGIQPNVNPMGNLTGMEGNQLGIPIGTDLGLGSQMNTKPAYAGKPIERKHQIGTRDQLMKGYNAVR